MTTVTILGSANEKPAVLQDLGARPGAMKVLVVDVGGNHVKLLVTGQSEPRKVVSGPGLTPELMMAGIKEAVSDWDHDVVTIGYPGPVLDGRPLRDPVNLGAGWVQFDFEAAFDRQVRIINDAAMQAIGSYSSGRMLFLGLGTGLGTTLIIEGIVHPMEMGHLPYKKSTFEDYVGQRELDRNGKKQWRLDVADVVARLIAALQPSDVVLGGGNVKKLKDLPPNTRPGHNANAFEGGFRLWDVQRSYISEGIRIEENRTLEIPMKPR